VFQCSPDIGSICTMNADGTQVHTLITQGRNPQMNAAGELLFHDDAYNVHKRLADGTMMAMGMGSFPKWTPDGRVVFQCDGLMGGICVMDADGTNRKSIAATGRAPRMNSTGDILFHDDTYTVQKRLSNATVQALGAGTFPTWTPSGTVLFQCPGLGGGICTMNADGSNRQTLVGAGRSPEMNGAGEILYYDDAGSVEKLTPPQAPVSVGIGGAFPTWTL
jgi:hypothetical protein